MQSNLESSPAVQRWMRQLRKKNADAENGCMSPSTHSKAIAALAKFTEYAKLSPDEIIRGAHEEIRATGSIDKYNDMLDGFWESYPTKTSAWVYFGMLKSFFRHNGIMLTTRMPTMPISKRHELTLTSEFIRRICNAAPLKHAAWMLMNNYLGLRIGAIPLLTVEAFHVENWTQERVLYPVTIRQELSGTFEYTGFIGYDAKKKLQSYFEGKTFPENRPWFMDSEGKYLISAFKRYAFHAGVIKSPEGVNQFGVPKGLCPIRTHLFRKRLQTILEGSNMPLNWVDHLLGHIPRGAQAKAYSRPSEDDLYKTFLAALPKLEIYGHYSQTPETQKQRILEAMRLQGVSDEKLEQISNIMCKARSKREMKDAIQNVMAYARQME